MELDYVINQLEKHHAVFEAMFKGCTPDEYNWKQAPEKWNLLEILCHLFDEEREDFRARVQHVLTTPDQPMPKTDPEAWVTARSYATQNYETMLKGFLEERTKSVSWLRGLSSPKWDNAYQHPQVGPVRANFLLVNWLAHDYLHIRQITKLRYDFLKQRSGESLDYAGNW